jgi:leader peptidase (prepilin peptidase) / N-methyltransferase
MVPTPWGPLPWFLTLLPAFCMGLTVGSFANVLIYRLPRSESIVFPGSHCPHCGRAIRPLENIPLLSWIMLGGRCRGCKERISFRYPLIEFLSACLALVSVKIFGFTYAGFAYGMLFIALMALVVIDLEHWLLPFAITLPTALIGLIGAIFFHLRPLADCLLGVLVGFALFMTMLFGGKFLFKRDAMGGGDVAFGIMAGAFLGWKLTLLMIFVASLLGTLISLPLLVLGKGISGRSVPFGPFLAVAMVVCIFWGDNIINWYIGLLQG